MKLKTLFLFSLVCAVGVIGCKDDDDNGSGGPTGKNCANAWATDLQNELNAISAAVSAYTNDQSTANCNALKAAYLDYVNALKPYGNCATLTGQQRADWEQALQDAEDNVDNIC